MALSATGSALPPARSSGWEQRERASAVATSGQRLPGCDPPPHDRFAWPRFRRTGRRGVAWSPMARTFPRTARHRGIKIFHDREGVRQEERPGVPQVVLSAHVELVTVIRPDGTEWEMLAEEVVDA